MCRNSEPYMDETKRPLRKEQATSWLIENSGSIALFVSNTESSAALAVSVDMATSFVVTLIKNIMRSYSMTRAAKLRLLEHLTTILREETE